MSDHKPEKISADDMVEMKCETLEKYIETRHATFELPKKMSFNWFLSWEDSRHSKVSKSTSCVRSGGRLRPRVDYVLERACETRKTIEKLDPAKQTEVDRLRAEKSDLERKLQYLAQDVYDLMLENDEYRTQLGISAAQRRDFNTVRKMAKLNG